MKRPYLTRIGEAPEVFTFARTPKEAAGRAALRVSPKYFSVMVRVRSVDDLSKPDESVRQATYQVLFLFGVREARKCET